MNIQVIIPVVNIRMFNILLKNILENTVLPSSIIIINNSSQHIKLPSSFSETKFIIINPPTPLYVNESWNLGISYLSKCDFVSILNDDIEIPKFFFERIAKGFKTFSNAGVICPCTVTRREGVAIFPVVDKYVKMQRVEGWAFTIKKSLLDAIPPIPPALEFFFGDDFFWWYVYRTSPGCLWYKDRGTVIYHAVGTSLRKIDKAKRAQIKRNEREVWYNLKTELIKKGIFNKA